MYRFVCMLPLDDKTFPPNSVYIFGFYFADRRFNHSTNFLKFISIYHCSQNNEKRFGKNPKLKKYD